MMTTAQPFSFLLALPLQYVLYVKLDLSFFCWLLHQCIDIIFHKAYICVYWMVHFLGGILSFIFDVKGYLLIWLVYCCDTGFIFKVLYVWSAKRIFVNQKTIDFEVGMKLRFSLEADIMYQKKTSALINLQNVLMGQMYF